MQKMQVMQVRSLGQEDPPEEDKATTPVFWTGESNGQVPWPSTVHKITELDMNEAT